MDNKDQTYNNLKDLIEGCLQGNRNSQEQLYRMYAKKMYAVCKHYAKDRDQAADMLQEGFITVFRKLDKYNFEGSFEGWIRRIIVNTALMELRKNKHFFEPIDERNDYSKASIITEQEGLDEKFKEKNIIEIINSLPLKAGLVIKLYVIEGYSHAEISEILDITVGTSKSQLNRARKLIKELM